MVKAQIFRPFVCIKRMRLKNMRQGVNLVIDGRKKIFL